MSWTVLQLSTVGFLTSIRVGTSPVLSISGRKINSSSNSLTTPYTRQISTGVFISFIVNFHPSEDRRCKLLILLKLYQDFVAKDNISTFHEICTYIFAYRSRFLRETDRRKNGMDFPKLYYPELYLMEGGYRAFFKDHQVSLHYRYHCTVDMEIFVLNNFRMTILC